MNRRRLQEWIFDPLKGDVLSIATVGEWPSLEGPKREKAEKSEEEVFRLSRQENLYSLNYLNLISEQYRWVQIQLMCSNPNANVFRSPFLHRRRARSTSARIPAEPAARCGATDNCPTSRAWLRQVDATGTKARVDNTTNGWIQLEIHYCLLYTSPSPRD